MRTHLNTIYRKLEVSSRIELLHCLETDGAAPVNEAGAVATKPTAERRQLTVMFVDLVGSTALAAELDAEDMHELLLAYRQTVKAELEAAGGHAAGFPGDGVVACFGWPKAMEDAAERAVRTALEIQAAMEKLAGPDGRPLRARIGIATGTVVVDGSKGDAESLTGGTPNLAARLQTVAEPGGIVIAAGTRDLVGDLFETEDLGLCEVKGLPAPVRVHALRGERQTVSRFEARQAGGLAPMVGRDVEFALMVERWERAKDGEGQAALLTGEAGIGKSRIAAALVEHAAAEQHTTIHYQTSPQQGDSPFWPIRRHLLTAAGIEQPGDEAARLAQLQAYLGNAGQHDQASLDILATLLDIEPASPLPAMSAKRRRELIVEALCGWLLGLARRAPLLVVIEDLHWLDPSSLEFLAALLSRSDSHRLMLVLTSRPKGEPPLAGHAHLTRISLSRLGKAAARSVVERLAGTDELDDELLGTILERTDGVPLYLEEMTRAVMEAGQDVRTVPASLQDSLMSRLDRQDTAKEVAQIAACIGREVDHDLLEAVVGGMPGELAAALDRLLEAELLFRRGDGYIFKHALVQDTAYQSLLRGRRAELHGRIAEALLGRFSARAAAEPQTVAHHLEQAGRREAAVDYYSRAADLANHTGANHEAKAYLERSLALILGMPEGAERDRREVAALTMLGRVAVAGEGHASETTRAIYSRALERCRATGLDRAEFPIVLGLTVQAAVSGNQQSALELARRLEQLANRLDDQVFAVEAQYGLGIVYSWRGDWRRSREHLLAGYRQYDTAQHGRHLTLYGQDPGPVCLSRLAWAEWFMGETTHAATTIADALALADRLGHAFSINYVLGWRALLAQDNCPPAEAEAACAEAMAQAAEQAFPTWQGISRICRVRWLLDHGDVREALAEAEPALALTRERGMGAIRTYALGLVGEGRRRCGDAAGGMACLEESRSIIDAGSTHWVEPEILRWQSRCRLDLDGGDTAAAEALLGQAREVASRQESWMLELRARSDLARLWADRGRRQEAHDLVAASIDQLPDAAGSPDLLAAAALCEQLQG